MRLEALLPLGKLDPGLRPPEVGLDLAAVAADARLLEELGYDGVVIEETKQDPYIRIAAAVKTIGALRRHVRGSSSIQTSSERLLMSSVRSR